MSPGRQQVEVRLMGLRQVNEVRHSGAPGPSLHSYPWLKPAEGWWSEPGKAPHILGPLHGHVGSEKGSLTHHKREGKGCRTGQWNWVRQLQFLKKRKTVLYSLPLAYFKVRSRQCVTHAVKSNWLCIILSVWKPDSGQAPYPSVLHWVLGNSLQPSKPSSCPWL